MFVWFALNFDHLNLGFQSKLIGKIKPWADQLLAFFNWEKEIVLVLELTSKNSSNASQFKYITPSDPKKSIF